MLRTFAYAAHLSLNAAMGWAHWPHRPDWGPTRVSLATLLIQLPGRSTVAGIDHPTILMLREIMLAAADVFDSVLLETLPGKHTLPIGIQIFARATVAVPDVATRAANLARESGPVVDSPALEGDEPIPADLYAHIGLHVPPPQDRLEQLLDGWAAAEQRERSADPNAVTPLTLQRETPLVPSSHGASKGRQRTRSAPPLSAGERNERHDARSREIDLIAGGDLERARVASASVNEHRAGPKLRGDSPRIKIRQRVPADLLLACAPLGDDIETILTVAVDALHAGTLQPRAKAG